MQLSVRQGVQWLTAPAVDDVPPAHARAMAGLRILAGLLWLYNVSWKRAPEFGQDNGTGLYRFTKSAVDHPVFPPYSWIVEHLVLPSFQAFGWMVLVAETSLAVLLLSGAFVRVAALIGMSQSLAIGLSVAQTPGEWPWAYWMMIGIHAALLFSSAGRVLAVDGVRAGVGSARTVVTTWAVVALGAGLVAAVLSVGDPLAGSGARLGGPGLSIGLGSYNLVGALLLLVVAGGLVAGGRTSAPGALRAAAAVALLAAASLHAQLGFTTPWLGGSPTSAAFFLTLAAVALGCSGHLTPSDRSPAARPDGDAGAVR